MNKDYCFTFQQQDFDYEPQAQQYQQITTDIAKDIIENSSTVAAYEVVPNEEDVDKEKEYQKKLCSGYYYNAATLTTTTTSTNKNKLSLNLNAEQISLKSQLIKLPTTTSRANSIHQTHSNRNNTVMSKFKINKSMATAHNNRRVRNLNDNKQQKQPQQINNKINTINFRIAPLNTNNNKEEVREEEEEDDEEQKNLPEIVLTSFETASTTAATTKLMPKKCSVKFQGVNQPITVNNMPPTTTTTTTTNINTTTNDINEDSVITDAEDSSELTSLPGGSTSPESILDNILSAASSVSVRNSSSLSSVGSDMTQLGVKNMTTNASIMPQVVILHANDEQHEQQQQEKIQLKENNMNLHMPIFINRPNNIKKKTLLEQISPMSRLSVTPQLTPNSNNSASSIRSQRSRTPSPSASFVLQATVEASIYPDEVKCKICHKVLQDPRTLNCLHTFCYQCLLNENFKQDSSIPFWSQPTNSKETNDWKGK